MSRAAAPLLQCPSLVITGGKSLIIPDNLWRGRLPPPTSSLPLLLVQQCNNKASLPITKLHYRRRADCINCRCSAAGDAAAAAEVGGAGGGEEPCEPHSSDSKDQQPKQWHRSKWKMDSAEMRSKLATLGLAAVLAYGLFDGVTYTTFFVLAFLSYEKSTGKNPAANIQALLGIVILMWMGNNVTRPFRVAGAAALSPVVDKGLKKIQEYFNLRRQVYAFALIVSVVALICLSIVGLLILSRWGK